jgi:hypothetical protein
MTVVSVADALDMGRSPFVGADVSQEAGFRLPAGTVRPMFEDDVWDFTAVIGLPVQMPLTVRRLDFTTIVDPRWRLVARELMLALLAPRHEAVAPLPRAVRTPLHLRTCHRRLAELTSWLNWLTEYGVAGLGEVDAEHCEAYFAHRRYVRGTDGEVIGERSPTTRRAAAQAVLDLVIYRELFTADRVDETLRPWAGASPSAIAEMPNGRGQNKTPPVSGTVLRPMLAAALYLIDTLGPHTVALARQARATSQARPRLSAIGRVPTEQFATVLDRYTRDRVPLPLLPEHDLRQRLAQGWAADDRLLPVSLLSLANEAGIRQFHTRWLPALRDMLEDTLALVGTDKPWGHRRCRAWPLSTTRSSAYAARPTAPLTFVDSRPARREPGHAAEPTAAPRPPEGDVAHTPARQSQHASPRQ